MCSGATNDKEDVILIVTDVSFHKARLQGALNSIAILTQFDESLALEVPVQIQLLKGFVGNASSYLVEYLLERPQLNVLAGVLLILPKRMDCDGRARVLFHHVENCIPFISLLAIDRQGRCLTRLFLTSVMVDSLLQILFLVDLLFLEIGVLTEAAEEVADDTDGQAVEEKDFSHQPEVNIWHLDIAVVALALEVSRVRPDEHDDVVEHQT